MSVRTADLILALPATDVGYLRAIFQGQKNVQWLYLGDSYLEHKEVERRLGANFSCRNSLPEFFDIAQTLAPEYVEWIDGISAQYGQDVEWWWGAISSRNQEQTNLFRRLCQMEMFKRLLEGCKDGPLLIIVASKSLATVLRSVAVSKGYSVRIHVSWARRFLSVRAGAGLFLQWVTFLGAAFFRAGAARLFPAQKHGVRFDLLLATIVQDKSVDGQGRFSDRYFPYLHEALTASAKQVAIFPFIYHYGFKYVSLLRRLRKSGKIFFLPEDDLSLADYLWAWLYPLREYRRKPPKGSFRGIDCTPMLLEECRGKASLVGLYPALVYRWAKRLAGRGVRFSRAVLWFENRVEDRAFVLGLRQAFPGGKIIGAQLFLYMPLWLSFRSTSVEMKAGVSPDVLLQPSEYQCGLARSFAPRMACEVRPALRYAHLFQSFIPKAFDRQHLVILIALSFRMEMAVETMDLVSEALGGMSSGIKIVVRPHPDLCMKKFLGLQGSRSWLQFDLDQQSLTESLQEVDMLIGSTSSIIVEAAVRGIPVVFIHGEALIDQNPLNGLHDGGVAECYRAGDIAKAVDRFIRLNDVERGKLSQTGRHLREKFFTPVDSSGMESLITRLCGGLSQN